MTKEITPGSDCPHVTLKRKNTANFTWYECAKCPQKFKAKEWDGKVIVKSAKLSDESNLEKA